MLNEPCGWPILECPEWPQDAEEIVDEVYAAATFIIWSLTGQRFSACEVTATPVPQCLCRRPGCSRECVLYLPGPVSEVLTVVVNGEEYADWALAADGTLWSSVPWPADVEVTYIKGFPPPAGADQAVMELALQIAKARCNDSSCQLPPNLVSRTREGDQVQFGDIPDGKTGLASVDMWIGAALRYTPGMSYVSTPDVDPWIVQRAPEVSP